MNVKKTFSPISVALLLCCGIFAGTALAQDEDIWGDYNYSSPTEMSMPESEPAPGWEPLSDLEEPAATDKPAKAAKQKPAKAPKPAKPPKAAKAPKPPKEPKSAPSGGDDRTLNVFANAGAAFGIGGYLVGEVNTLATGGSTVNDNKDYYMNMGQGLRFEIGAGYMATPNLEARFSVDFNIGLLAPKIEERSPGDRQDVIDYSYFSWGIKAMAAPQFEVLELFDMYIGAGLNLNFAYATRDSTYTQANANLNTVYDMQFSPAVGFCGAIGFILPLSDVMDALGELQFESKSFAISKQVLKSYSGQTPPSDEIVYEKNAGDDRFAPPLYSGSNWGIRVGIRYWISL